MISYPGPRGFLLFFNKFDANRFFCFIIVFSLARSARSREKKASGQDRISRLVFGLQDSEEKSKLLSHTFHGLVDGFN